MIFLTMANPFTASYNPKQPILSWRDSIITQINITENVSIDESNIFKMEPKIQAIAWKRETFSDCDEYGRNHHYVVDIESTLNVKSIEMTNNIITKLNY